MRLRIAGSALSSPHTCARQATSRCRSAPIVLSATIPFHRMSATTCKGSPNGSSVRALPCWRMKTSGHGYNVSWTNNTTSSIRKRLSVRRPNTSSPASGITIHDLSIHLQRAAESRSYDDQQEISEKGRQAKKGQGNNALSLYSLSSASHRHKKTVCADRFFLSTLCTCHLPYRHVVLALAGEAYCEFFSSSAIIAIAMSPTSDWS